MEGMTDNRILNIVRRAIKKANDINQKFEDMVDIALACAGAELHEDQPAVRDHECIVRLADGREVYLETDGPNPGYTITNMYHHYTVDIDGGEGGSTVIQARNNWEAVQLATKWVHSGEWRCNGLVSVSVYNRHCDEDFVVTVVGSN